jgi:hypothetical protein
VVIAESTRKLVGTACYAAQIDTYENRLLVILTLMVFRRPPEWSGADALRDNTQTTSAPSRW